MLLSLSLSSSPYLSKKCSSTLCPVLQIISQKSQNKNPSLHFKNTMNLNNILLFISICYCNYFLLVFSSKDASALLDFKSKADLHNKLDFPHNNSASFCKWEGVQCFSSRAVKIILENKNITGIFAPSTLTRLSQLRVLSLRNNSLTGPIPDLSGLQNLKVLFLSHNYFSGSVPSSISSLHRIKTLDLSYNMLSGSIPVSLNRLDRLYYLRLDFNRFNGSVPAFNYSSLQIFNVSHNDLTGTIPLTPTLSRFKTTSFDLNPGLCGEILHKECRSTRPFFSIVVPPPPAVVVLSQTTESHGKSAALNSKSIAQKHKRTALVIGFSIGVSLFVISIVFLTLFTLRRRRSSRSKITKIALDPSVTGNAETVVRIEEEHNELEEKVKRVQEVKQQQIHMVGKSGILVFCAGEAQLYTLDQLMRASAELLGRGTMGTTYKAVLDSRLIVTVKRLDGGRFAGASREVFEEHMEAVGGLRHPTLVPLRAYFQAKEERLLVYDYQPNGSLFSLIHGSKSSRAKPLHWTSCLKIAEDLSQGLSYIHQAWRLVHGNLKSTNVLLGSDFEACLTDYCLVALAGPTSDEDDDAIAYRAPEIRKFGHHEAISKCDVYSFGVLLLELLTGKYPSQHPNLQPEDMMNWVRSAREENSEENRSRMILEVALACRVVSPEQRPTMWQVMKMIQEIKEVVLSEDGELVEDSQDS